MVQEEALFCNSLKVLTFDSYLSTFDWPQKHEALVIIWGCAIKPSQLGAVPDEMKGLFNKPIVNE